MPFQALLTLLALASKSKLLSFEPEIAAAYNAEVIKQKLKAKRALGLEKMDLEDILITMTDQYHVLTIVPGNKFFVYTIASKDSNLAIIRNALRKRLADIANNIA
jgi:predicted regulator of Ras-like GTPase activity (Roadblock/LC7/MglB family)